MMMPAKVIDRRAMSGFVAVLALTAGTALAAPPAPMTAQQDHQNMMDQLHITTLRPGFSGDENAADHANYDPAKANPFPDYPDALTMEDGTPVTTAAQWWTKRRPQIVEAFEREVVGRIPAHVPKVTWTQTASEREFFVLPGGFRGVTATRLNGHVDNSAAPGIAVDIRAMLILPEGAKNVPVLIMFGSAAFPAPMPPGDEDLARIDTALKAQLVARDPGLAEVFAKHPGYRVANAPAFPPSPPETRLQDLIGDGWGVLMVDTASIQADDGALLTRGIIGLANKGRPRKPDDWGALRAWGWGASRALDYLQTRPEVDFRHVGIEGVSRYGKAALITAAFDQRFSMVLIGSSGEGGVKPHRRNWGEAVENMTGVGAYHWMAGNFLKYGGPKNAGDIPVDSPELLALVAPRLAFVSYGVPDKGDARWLDHQGSFMATVNAGRVWTLLGAKDLGVGNDYKAASMPPPLTDLLGGQLAWRQHTGGHTDAPNMASFIAWADRNMGRKAQVRPAAP
jgi:hypothetical protein